MSTSGTCGIRSIVFDLDGTLYVSESFAAAIQETAAGYIALLKGISKGEACLVMAATRLRLEEEQGVTPPLSSVCAELGGSIRELHKSFESQLRPEAHLVRDGRVVTLLERLGEQYSLFLYTNNNRALTTRIIGYLGLEGFFCRIIAIDDTWRSKPDEEVLRNLLLQSGLKAAETLFVGDRYDVDLRLPEQHGCPVYLSQNIDQLLHLEKLLAQGFPVT